MSKHRVFSDATVNAVQTFVLDKFPSTTSSGRSRKSATATGKPAKPSQSSYEYGILEDSGYLKANESQAASALIDPNCTKKGRENNHENNLYKFNFNII